jgi:hypothetical protein
MYFPENGPKQIQIPIKFQTQQMAFPFLSQLRIEISTGVFRLKSLLLFMWTCGQVKIPEKPF